MTVLLYQMDSYIQAFDARVTDVDAEGGRVALNRTAFYPGGGGQPHDTGRLGGWRVTKTAREGEAVWHWIEGEGLPTPGDYLHGAIDWQRRYALMRTHTAMHILCGVVWRDYGAQVTGGSMEPGKGRMDFEFANLQKELVSEIEARCNAEIAAARAVRVQILPRGLHHPRLDPHQDQPAAPGHQRNPHRGTGGAGSASRRRHPRAQHSRGRGNESSRLQIQRCN